MIQIITVHHETDDFMNLQAAFLKTYTKNPYTVHCGMGGIPEEVRGYAENFNSHTFKLVTTIPGVPDGIGKRHWYRLNYLFHQMLEFDDYDDTDILIFLDSDAFPVVAGWDEKIKEYLQDHQAAAIHRIENIEPRLKEKYKPYPHPCFFATTVKFWRENNLGWGIKPPEVEGTGPLLKIFFDENGHKMKQLLRTNCFNLHPLFYGVYDDMIYHHGCGNRIVYDSIDVWGRPELGEKFGVSLDQAIPKIPEFNKKISQEVYRQIMQDPHFIAYYFRGVVPDPETKE